ncbi:MAG: hypothetical protein JKX81_13800 [Arenicella sp.]|nr:hypothetical protein [Arenicella sp.]
MRRAAKRNRLYSVAVPLFAILLSFRRYIKFPELGTRFVNAIKANLAAPFDLDQSRHWMLSIFPMPYHIEAGSLNTGDIHTIKTRYQRWFVTNTHEGEAQLLIQHVGPNTVRTTLLSDTTYFAAYLKLHGTQIEFQSLEHGGTENMLQIDFERKLDPVFYFQPVQKFGVSKMAEFLIEEIMIREDSAKLR